MRTDTTVRTQLARSATDPLRVLVVGAGVAGLTIAQLLRRAGLHPVLVERADANADPGYMLALMPMADPAIRRLGVRDAYLARSVALRRYGLRSHTGRPLREDSFDAVIARFGDYRGISRGELLDVLGGPACTISYGTTVAGLRQSVAEVAVTLESGGDEVEGLFDLVVAADGLHSTTRGLVLPADRVQMVDSRWGGWVVWAPPDDDADLTEELWGSDFFVGSYPVPDRLGVFVGGPRAATRAGPASFADHIRRRLRRCDGRLGRVLTTLESEAEPYYWPLTDCRAADWSAGRVLLLGDATAGFMPTAGIGAGMAIESASVLATVLRDAEPADVPALLGSYEKAQRPRVEAAQNMSRTLARVMFRRSSTLAAIRDAVMSVVGIEIALSPIKKLLTTSPAQP